MDDAATVEALKRFGLSTYEARAFVALQKLGTATASEISDHAEVPRSQVYGAAEGLERRGLVEVHQATPTRYRPVTPEEARTLLLAELEAAGERAFDHLAAVQGALDERDGRREAVWTVSGREAVAARTAELVAAAEERVVYGTGAETRLEPAVLDALRERAADGASVVAVSGEPAVQDRFADLPGVDALAVPAELGPNIATGRVIVVDRDGVLVSIVGAAAPTGDGEETAVWSAETAFAGVFVALVEQWLEAHLPVADDGRGDADGGLADAT